VGQGEYGQDEERHGRDGGYEGPFRGRHPPAVVLERHLGCLAPVVGPGERAEEMGKRTRPPPETRASFEPRGRVRAGGRCQGRAGVPRKHDSRVGVVWVYPTGEAGVEPSSRRSSGEAKQEVGREVASKRASNELVIAGGASP
jgi:hypothetical protein